MKRNPNDATFRNIRALTKRVDLLVRQMKDRTRRLDIAERGGTVNSIAIRKLQGRS